MSLDAKDTSKLLDELSSSILRQASTSKTYNERRLQDTFRRRVKRHNYGRTNQFEVMERLDGLEEKFQILTLDNLSDALHQRRLELREYEHQWLPDILDLMLHLANDPTRNENLLRMYRIPPRLGTPPPLRWKDILADDPIDRNDRLWRVPSFRDTDDSGYDDYYDGDETSLTTSADVSPSKKRGGQPLDDPETAVQAILHSPTPLDIDSLIRDMHLLHSTNQISETVFIREVLFVLRGLPSRILRKETSSYKLTSDLVVSGISPSIVKQATMQLSRTRHQVDLVQSWIVKRQEFAYIEAMKDAVESILNSYYSKIDVMQQELLTPGRSTTASVIRTLYEVSNTSMAIATITEFLEQADQKEAISCLENLFSYAQAMQACNDLSAYRTLLAILVPSLNTYLKPCWKWLNKGELADTSNFFFIKSNTNAIRNSRLWHDRYSLIKEGPMRPPRFMSGVVSQIMSCGKTAVFIRQLSSVPHCTTKDANTDLLTQHVIQSARSDSNLSFAEAFQSACFGDVNSLLESHTRKLKSLLDARCGVHHTLDAINQIYLGNNAIMLGDVEPKIFDRIDRCIEGWNDRFEIRDMLEAAFATANSTYTLDAVSIRSTFTSSRTMQSRRRSVKILNALSLHYRLSWPLANIIDEQSLLVYRRVALTLMQIRRARYSLLHNGYLSVMSLPIESESSPRDQSFAQILAFTLLGFINNLYDCLTVSIMRPLAQHMCREMQEALTLDDMISAHKDYIHRLECACLVSTNLKMLRQTLVTILDLCIRFSDLVSNSAKSNNDGSDVEVGSFTSAFSRHRAGRGDGTESEDESDTGGVGDGYSSFIVLDEHTSVIKEMRKLKSQYHRHLKFFIAGLQGVGKAGSNVQDLNTLADRLGTSWQG